MLISRRYKTMKALSRILYVILSIITVLSALPLFAVAEVFAANDDPVVYLSMSAGADSNTGTKNAPVKTITAAFSVLAKTQKGGTIVVMDGVNTRTNDSSGILTLDDAGGTVTITTSYGGVDYRDTNDARLMLYYGLAFQNDVVFDAVDFLQVKATENRAIYLCHNDLTINANCATYKYGGKVSDYNVGNCPPKDTPIAREDGVLAIITGYQSASSETPISFGNQKIELNGGRYGRIYVGNKQYQGTDSSPTEQNRADAGDVWITVGEKAAVSYFIDATTDHTAITTHVMLANNDTTVNFNNGVDPSRHVAVDATNNFENLGFSLKNTDIGPAIGVNEAINVNFVDTTPISEFGYVFMLEDSAPFANLGSESAHRSLAYTEGESGDRNYQYAKGATEAFFKGILVYDEENAKYHYGTEILAYPYAIDGTTGYSFVGKKQSFTLEEVCNMILNDPSASDSDKQLAALIREDTLNYHIQRFAADDVPEATTASVVYVSQNGHENGDGSSDTSTVTFKKALGMVKENGGVIVVCETITLDPADTISTKEGANDTGASSQDFIYYFPHTNNNVTITSYYGKNYAKTNGAEIHLTSEVAFYGTYTFKNCRFNNVNQKEINLYLQYNPITFDNGITCNGNGIAIVCGYNASRPEWTSLEEISCRADVKITVKSGSWSYLKGGNHRKNKFISFGDVAEGAKLYISIEGGTFTSTTTPITVTGMNSVNGEVYLEILGGTINNDIYLISRAGATHTAGSNENGKYIPQTHSADDLIRINGKVTLKISGGTFNTTTINSLNQSNTVTFEDGSTGKDVTVSSSAQLTICIAGGTFNNAITPNMNANSDKLILPSSSVGNIILTSANINDTTKSDTAIAEIVPPTLSTNSTVYTAPPSYDREIVEGSLDPNIDNIDNTDTNKATLTNLELIKEYYDRRDDDHDANQEYRSINDVNYNFTGVESIEFIGMLSGEYSINKTITNYSIGGAGGGYMIDCGDFVLFAFGDSKPEDGKNGTDNTGGYNNGGPWRANTLAFTDDDDYMDGILLDGFYMSEYGAEVNGTHANEFLLSSHDPGAEQSKIPTGGIMVDDTLYMGYMSVRRWSKTGEDGIWKCNYGGIAISRDMGRTWETPSDLRWPEDSGFAQLYPVLDGDWVYIFGVPAGRKGACKLMRVPAAEIENFAAYEYLVGYDTNGKGIFEKGDEAMMTDFAAIEESVGGVVVMYNEYLGEWVIVYCSGKSGDIEKNAIYMRSAANLNGKWSDPVVVISQQNNINLDFGFGTVYEPRICAKYQNSETGEMMLICSNMTKIDNDYTLYNSMIFNVKLERRGNPVINIVD